MCWLCWLRVGVWGWWPSIGGDSGGGVVVAMDGAVKVGGDSGCGVAVAMDGVGAQLVYLLMVVAVMLLVVQLLVVVVVVVFLWRDL